jgi:hypothetical protein
MPLDTVAITGTFNFPDATWTQYARAEFVISGFDTDGEVVTPGTPTRANLTNSGGLSVNLWPNTAGLRGTVYSVFVDFFTDDSYTKRFKRVDFGKIQVDGPANIEDLLLVPVTIPGVWYSMITQAEYEAFIAAAEDAVAAAEDAIAAQEFLSGVLNQSQVFRYTATAGQTVFTGADVNGAVLEYRVGQTPSDQRIDVFRNGVLMIRGQDYTETNTGTVTFLYGLAAGDSVVIKPRGFGGEKGDIGPSGTAPIFSTRAVALTATIPGDVDSILIGGLAYFRDSRVSVTAGNAAYVHSDNSRWSPKGLMTFQHFGENTNPGTTDMRPAINRLIAFIKATQVHVNEDRPGIPVSGLGETLAHAGPIYTGGTKWVSVQDAIFKALPSGEWTYWNGSSLDAIGRPIWGLAQWNLNVDAALDPARHSRTFTFTRCHFDGGKVAAGAVAGLDTRGSCGLTRCSGLNHVEFSVYTPRGVINSGFHNLHGWWRHFAVGDADAANYNNWPAVGLDLRSNDHITLDNNISGFKIPLRVAGFGRTNINHPWCPVQGTINLPAGGPVAIEVFSSAGNVQSNYIDSGKTVLVYNSGTGASVFNFSLNQHISPFLDLNQWIEITTATALTSLNGWVLIGNVVEKVGTSGSDVVFLTTGSGSYRAPSFMSHYAAGNRRGNLREMVGLPDFTASTRVWAANTAIQEVGFDRAWITQNTSATTFTAAQRGGASTGANARIGDRLTIICNDANTTIQHNATVNGRFLTVSGSNITCVNGRAYEFVMNDAGYWAQV